MRRKIRNDSDTKRKNKENKQVFQFFRNKSIQSPEKLKRHSRKFISTKSQMKKNPTLAHLPSFPLTTLFSFVLSQKTISFDCIRQYYAFPIYSPL